MSTIHQRAEHPVSTISVVIAFIFRIADKLTTGVFNILRTVAFGAWRASTSRTDIKWCALRNFDTAALVKTITGAGRRLIRHTNAAANKAVAIFIDETVINTSHTFGAICVVTAVKSGRRRLVGGNTGPAHGAVFAVRADTVSVVGVTVAVTGHAHWYSNDITEGTGFTLVLAQVSTGIDRRATHKILLFGGPRAVTGRAVFTYGTCRTCTSPADVLRLTGGVLNTALLVEVLTITGRRRRLGRQAHATTIRGLVTIIVHGTEGTFWAVTI